MDTNPEQRTNTEAHIGTRWGPAVPLKDVCESVFGLTHIEAARRAAIHDLPVPVFRLRDSQKSPYLIRAKELAEYLDRRADEAAKQWERSQA